MAERAGQAGFTLVELLVVLVIVAVAGTIGALGLGALARGSADGSLAAFRDRYAALRDEARLTGRAAAIGFTAQGYTTFDRIDGGWQPREDGHLPVLAAIEVDGSALRLDPGYDTGPAVLLAPDGDATPFALTPLDPAAPALRVAANGSVVGEEAR